MEEKNKKTKNYTITTITIKNDDLEYLKKVSEIKYGTKRKLGLFMVESSLVAAKDILDYSEEDNLNNEESQFDKEAQ